MEKLNSLNCEPCQKGGQPMNRPEAEQLLKQLSEGWHLSKDTKWLNKHYAFNNYQETVKFVNQVAEIAEVQNHHPDINFTWGKCTITIQTHKIGGLHKNDFILAANTVSYTHLTLPTIYSV